MTKKLKSLEEAPLDIFESIKRAFIHRGFIPKKHRRRNDATKPSPKKLVDLTSMSHDIFFKANTVFPFTLFPDTVTVDREKLTFATRYFFGVAKIISIPIRDLLSVEADVGPFFGSVHIASRFFNPTPYSINFLKRSDAIKLQRLLQGAIIALEQEIDAPNLSKEKIIALLTDLGKGDTD